MGVREVIKVDIFHILENLVDAHIEAFKNKEIVDGCYIDRYFEQATNDIITAFLESLPVERSQTDCDCDMDGGCGCKVYNFNDCLDEIKGKLK